MGTRFQRQIRTDRVRPQGRARAGTGPSSTPHSRGHSRNLSTSSIGSTASTFSQPPEIRRRPTSLIMPHDNSARTRLALDGMVEPPSTPPAQIRGSIPGPSVGGSPYTPSHMFSGAPEHLASPMSTASQASGFWDGKTAARRLSVPAGINPFVQQQQQQQPVHAYPRAMSVRLAKPLIPVREGFMLARLAPIIRVMRQKRICVEELGTRLLTLHTSGLQQVA